MAWPSFGSMKSWTLTCSGWPWGRHSRPPFLKSPTNSFFFVSTEMTGWPRALEAPGLVVDVLELGVAIEVLARLRGLAVGLQAVAQPVQRARPPPCGADRCFVSPALHNLRRLRERPQQGLHRIAARRGLNQSLEIPQQRGVLRVLGLRPPPRLRIRPAGADTAGTNVRNTAINRGARKTADPRQRTAYPAVTQ